MVPVEAEDETTNKLRPPDIDTKFQNTTLGIKHSPPLYKLGSLEVPYHTHSVSSSECLLSGEDESPTQKDDQTPTYNNLRQHIFKQSSHA